MPQMPHMPNPAALTTTTERGWLLPTDDFLRLFLARPELALVPESCAAEHALHAALQAQPSRAVAPDALNALKDPDARESYTLFLRFRDDLLTAGTLEAWYLGLFRGHHENDAGGHIRIPPLFIDMVVEAVIGRLMEASSDVYEMRAADMLFRSQRISTTGGQVLSGDRETLDMLNETGGLGDFGRFLAEAKAPLRAVQLQVLGDDNAPDFLASRGADRRQAGRHTYLLDLTHEVTNDLSHGLVFTMTRARSGLKALASVLQQIGRAHV